MSMAPGDLVISTKVDCVAKIDGIRYVNSWGHPSITVDFGRDFFFPRIMCQEIASLVGLKKACHRYAANYIRGLHNLKYGF